MKQKLIDIYLLLTQNHCNGSVKVLFAHIDKTRVENR